MTTLAPLSPTERTVLRMIEAAADAGAACPSNPALAEASGCSEVSSIAKILGKIEYKGWISIDRRGDTRTITLVTTGGRVTSRSTGASRDRAPAAAPAAPLVERPRTLARVDRDPCFRCGVRADIGCAHRAAAVAEVIAA